MAFDGASGGGVGGDVFDEFAEFVDVGPHLLKAAFVFLWCLH